MVTIDYAESARMLLKHIYKLHSTLKQTGGDFIGDVIIVVVIDIYLRLLALVLFMIQDYLYCCSHISWEMIDNNYKSI